MNILADYHHADLWWSLQLLADRLGAKLYRPYGMEWFDEGYFKLYGDLNKKDPYRWLAKQYLVDTVYTYDPKTGVGTGHETYYGCVDYPKFNLLTLEKAKETPIDIVLCTVNENEEYFGRLKEFYPKAKFIRQVGNEFDTHINEELYPNLLSSATEPYNAFSKHKIIYRQEFDMNLFRSRPIKNYNHIYSFQGDLEHEEVAWDMWIDLKHMLPDFTFKSYGVTNLEGKIFPKRAYIEAMLQSAFVYQYKFYEGYGHVLHNALALGRVLIIDEEFYRAKIAGPLLKDESTCLFLEDTPQKTANKIRRWATPEGVKFLGSGAESLFKLTVNFDEEFVELKKFFEELI